MHTSRFINRLSSIFFTITFAFITADFASAQVPFNKGGSVAGKGVINGTNSNTAGVGVRGVASSTTGKTRGLLGITHSKSNYAMGVLGIATSNLATTGYTYGVVGQSKSPKGRGVVGQATALTGATRGIVGITRSKSNYAIGVAGIASSSLATTGYTYGAWGQSNSPKGRGVFGYASSTTGATRGVYGLSKSPTGVGVYGRNTGGGEAGHFDGDVAVTGDLDVGGSITGLATLTTSGGVGDAGGIPALDGTGKLDSSFIPPAITTTLTGNVTGNVTGNLTGNADTATTATALVNNGNNCPPNEAPSGVDATGNVEGCFAVTTPNDLNNHINDNFVHGATNLNTVNQIVRRDASGNFSAGTITASLSGNASTATALAGPVTTCSAGQYASGIDTSGNATGCTATSSDWGLTGNAGTVDGTNFLGTTDNVALEMKVSNVRAFRIEPHATSPNIIGGYFGNTVTAGKLARHDRRWGAIWVCEQRDQQLRHRGRRLE